MAMTNSQNKLRKSTPAADRTVVADHLSVGGRPLSEPGRVEHGSLLRTGNDVDAPGILSINFLPNEYRERGDVRKKTLWQTLVLLVFGGVVAATVLFQLDQRRAARAQVAAIAGPYAFAQARVKKLEQLQNELRRERQTAALLVYLQHPWPRTQILMAATKPLPASVTLEELQVVRETPDLVANERTQDTLPRRPAQQQEEEVLLVPPPVRDQEALRAENDSLRVVVLLTGVTQNTEELHAYLVQVLKSPLIDQADLKSLEGIEDESQAGKSRFAVVLKVTPGFGQPGGPEGPLTKVAEIAAASAKLRENAG